MARVQMVEKETALPDIKKIFEKIESAGDRVLNIFKVVGNSPKIGRDFLRLGTAILVKGSLDPALRELAILRVGNLAQANYEWTQHVPIGLETGLSQQQIDEISNWEKSGLFNDKERAVLRYTDEIAINIRVSDETFSILKNAFNDQEIVELTITIGYYGMVSRLLEALQVELEK
ncbi:MAG: carboxymuconolactone decarboxylase family protein [Desulfobacterales bacterium]|nr:carboxymuconolactone decarboxylase family protein [Desulfobacterales bacterium]